MSRSFPLSFALFATMLCQIAQASPRSSSRDTTWMNGEFVDGKHGDPFHSSRCLPLADGSVRILDTIRPRSFSHREALIGPFRIRHGAGKDSARWLIDTAIYSPDTTLRPWSLPENLASRYRWIGTNIHVDRPFAGEINSIKGLWQNAILNRHGEVVSGTNLLPSTIGDTVFLAGMPLGWNVFPFRWKVPPGLLAHTDSLLLPPVCTLRFAPRLATEHPATFRWLDSSGEEISTPRALTFRREGPFPVLRARWGRTEWTIATDSSNFRQPKDGDIRGTVRIRPDPDQPFLLAGQSIGEALNGRFDTVRLPRPVVKIRPDGWTETSATTGWILSRSSGSQSFCFGASSRIWSHGARAFQVVVKNAKTRTRAFEENNLDSTDLVLPAPENGDDWALDSLSPPLDPRLRLPLQAFPPLWDTSAPLEVMGMGTARLDPVFWWTRPDTLETSADILLSPDWRRGLGRDSLHVWVKLHRPLEQILDSTSPWRPRISDFRIRVDEYEPFALPDSSWIGGDGKAVFWTTRCVKDSLSMILEGPLKWGERDESIHSAVKRYRRAIATATGVVLDSGAAECQILSRKDGITFSVDEVVQKDLESTSDDSDWISDARSIAQEGVERSFPNVDTRPEIKQEDLHPVASRHGSLPLVRTGGNPFVGTFLLAWNNHHPVRLSPDHVWMAIMDGVSLHIAKKSEKWRKRLKIGHSGKRELKLQLSPQDYAIRDSALFWETISRHLLDAMPDSTQHLLEEHFLAKYTTTTPMVEVAYRMKILESVQPFFDYAGSVSCGIPRITLEGTPDDWIQLRTRARRLGKLGFSKWMEALDPVLTEFVKSSQGSPSLAFWRSFFRQHTRDGCDVVYLADGWITRFFPLERDYSDLRFREDLSGTLDLRFVPKGAGSFPFTLVDHTRTPNPTHRYRIVSGFVGISQDSATGELSPDIGWVVFEDSTGRR